MGRVEGKTALITGASRGIGRAVAIELAREGAKVAINFAHSEDKAQEVAEEIGKLGGSCLLAQANLAVPAEARAMVEKVANEFTHLDILVNNAGITRDSLLPRMTDEQWVEVINTNLNGCFFCTSAAIPFMTAQSYGRIVNISSMNGQIPALGQANYSASKGGIIAFTRTTAALELARIQAYQRQQLSRRAITDTDMFAEVPPRRFRRRSKRSIPLGRFAKPEEIAKAVLVPGSRR